MGERMSGLGTARMPPEEPGVGESPSIETVEEPAEGRIDWQEALEEGPRVDLERLVDELETRVESSRQIMNHAIWVDLDEFFELTRRIKASLPDEVKRAARVSREGNRIIEDARDEARRMLDEARQEADRLVRSARAEAERLIETGEIQRLATERATQIVAQADQRADEVRRGADAYARQVLSSVETTVRRVLEAVEEGKRQLE